MSKYYAVKIGRKPGIYQTWDECQKQIHHFKNAKFKSFTSKDDAYNFLNDKIKNENHLKSKSHNQSDISLTLDQKRHMKV